MVQVHAIFLMEYVCLCILIYKFTCWNATALHNQENYLKGPKKQEPHPAVFTMHWSQQAHFWVYSVPIVNFLTHLSEMISWKTFHSGDLQINPNKVSSVKITFPL